MKLPSCIVALGNCFLFTTLRCKPLVNPKSISYSVSITKTFGYIRVLTECFFSITYYGDYAHCLPISSTSRVFVLASPSVLWYYLHIDLFYGFRLIFPRIIFSNNRENGLFSPLNYLTYQDFTPSDKCHPPFMRSDYSPQNNL